MKGGGWVIDFPFDKKSIFWVPFATRLSSWPVVIGSVEDVPTVPAPMASVLTGSTVLEETKTTQTTKSTWIQDKSGHWTRRTAMSIEKSPATSSPVPSTEDALSSPSLSSEPEMMQHLPLPVPANLRDCPCSSYRKKSRPHPTKYFSAPERFMGDEDQAYDPSNSEDLRKIFAADLYVVGMMIAALATASPLSPLSLPTVPTAAPTGASHQRSSTAPATSTSARKKSHKIAPTAVWTYLRKAEAFSSDEKPPIRFSDTGRKLYANTSDGRKRWNADVVENIVVARMQLRRLGGKAKAVDFSVKERAEQAKWEMLSRRLVGSGSGVLLLSRGIGRHAARSSGSGSAVGRCSTRARRLSTTAKVLFRSNFLSAGDLLLV